MHRWIWLVAGAVMVLGTAVGAAEPEPGRTDGPEGSEIGTGGYTSYRTLGQFYAEGFFGSAAIDIEKAGSDESISNTDLLAGINLGYMVEDWLAVQVGYGQIDADQKIGLYSIGMRNSVNTEPFSYFFSFDAEIFSPDVGDSHFGLVPGVGADLVLHENVQLGVRAQRDFIFSDDNITVTRFAARLQFKF